MLAHKQQHQQLLSAPSQDVGDDSGRAQQSDSVKQHDNSTQKQPSQDAGRDSWAGKSGPSETAAGNVQSLLSGPSLLQAEMLNDVADPSEWQGHLMTACSDQAVLDVLLVEWAPRCFHVL